VLALVLALALAFDVLERFRHVSDGLLAICIRNTEPNWAFNELSPTRPMLISASMDSSSASENPATPMSPRFKACQQGLRVVEVVAVVVSVIVVVLVVVE
jgi:hypothetical protein